MTNKKKFWIGMSSLAAIGAITATVAYFSSVHVFQPNNFATDSYNVTATKVLDTGAAGKMVPNEKLDATVSVKNEGNIGVLSRITYYFESDLLDGSGPLACSLDELNALGWYFDVDNSNTFIKGTDKSYYYKGIIDKGTTVNHLTGITYKSTGTNAESSGVETDKGSNTKTITYSISDRLKMTVVIETIQATTDKGVDLTVPESATAETLKDYWTALNKGTPATPGGV